MARKNFRTITETMTAAGRNADTTVACIERSTFSERQKRGQGRGQYLASTTSFEQKLDFLNDCAGIVMEAQRQY